MYIHYLHENLAMIIRQTQIRHTISASPMNVFKLSAIFSKASVSSMVFLQSATCMMCVGG